MNPYSTLKAAWHTDRIERLRLGKPIAPVELQLILSDLCNHDCYFCAYRSSIGLSAERFVEFKDGERNHNPNRMIETGKAREIIKDAADCGVKSIIFTGGGEPTVHPDHIELFDYALSLGIECSLNTNGALLRPGWEDVLPRFAYVRLSIDAGSPEVYSKVRKIPPGVYRKVLRNLQQIRDAVDSQGRECVVGAGYVVTPDNFKDVYRGVEDMRANGAHYVRLAAMQSTIGYECYNGTWQAARAEAKKSHDLAERGFAVIDLMDDVIGEKPDYPFCGFQHFVMYVGANLECYRCCYTAYTDLGLVGSLKDKSLKEYIAERDLTFDARSCDVCPLNQKNKVIQYLTQKDPMHVNFV